MSMANGWPEEDDTNLVEDSSNTTSTSTPSDEPNQMENRIRTRTRGFNLRKSMAWNNAFFTEQGVLNPQELSRLNGYSSKFSKEFLSGIPEEEAKSLLEDSVRSRSNSQHLDGELFCDSPLRPVSSDPKVITRLSPKLDIAQETTAVGSKTFREPKLVKGVNKGLLKAGGCPKTLSSASQKRLSRMDLRNPQMKGLKIPRFAILKPEDSSVSAPPKLSALGSKHFNCNRIRQEGNLEKNAFPEGSSSISRTKPSTISLTARPSILSSGKDMKLSINQNFLQGCKATAGLKVMSNCLPTPNANRSKAVIPLPQKSSSGTLTSAQICPTKPSGLRMPSPSLRYFSQPQASVSLNAKSPRDAPSCNFCISNTIPRTFGDTYHTGEMRSLREPAGSVRMCDLGLNAKTSLTPAATTTSHPYIKFNNDAKQSVGEVLQASSLGISKREVYGVKGKEILIQDQHGEEAREFLESKILYDVDSQKAVRLEVSLWEEQESKNLIHHEVEKAKHKKSIISQENSEQRIIEYSFKDNDTAHYGGNKSKFNFSSMDTGNSDSSHLLISDSELHCELEKTVHSGHIKEFKNDGLLGNLCDAPSMDEEFRAGDLEISYDLPLVNSVSQNSGVSGADYLIEHKFVKELPESLKISTVDRIERKSLVCNDFLQVSYDINTLSEVQKEQISLGEAQNTQHEKGHTPQIKDSGLIEQESTVEQSLEDNDFVNLTRSGSKNGVSSISTEITDLYGTVVSCEKKRELDNSDAAAEDKDAVIQKKRKSPCDSRHDALTLKHKLNAAPFSDEWVAALEEAGEEILTMKTGAVQNSPPDKFLPQPGPWSPVKRKNIPELGPFDCTKYTSLPLPKME